MCFRFPLKPEFERIEFFGRQYDIEDDKFVWFSYNDTQEIFELHVR